MTLRALLATALLVISTSVADAAPKSELWDRWLKHDANSTKTVDHSAWDAFLAKYIKDPGDGVNRVAYTNVTEADHKALADYIKRLEKTDVDALNRAEQKAYWINLYNALTVRVIIDNLPVDSILDISSGLFTKGPWKEELLEIKGEDLTLDDIEHRILRPIYNDPLVHYGVNCASFGCPNLATKAYTAANTKQLLVDGAKSFVNHPRGVRFDGNDLIVSSIYAWFEEDFGGSDKKVIEHLKKFANPDLRAKLEKTKEIDSDEYDWNLNGLSKAGS